MEYIVYAVGGIAGAVIIITVLRMILETVRIAVDPEDGIDAFVRSFDANQFEDREDR